ncbi:peptide methionine sulfoxide reductase, partial [Acinetobacter radioresistens]|uniref:Peptide methionine sulfoxide reductase n=1 Tax=Leeuwenhoekiella aestuarii TaxID=2249426 RepID=A0A4Q0NVD1_9FLAO|nr:MULTISPECIES: peptide methionine sulfoxide reductase [Bacteria]MCK4106542.1 peptide methionine sulfoxide reductase [Acinetobacter radioresistens]RXG15226.1 hypothetical protein DSM04_103114 [Leeuwenhoekiella aestuarii]RXG17663.1 hypothetical protein DSM03_102540 [Leeuwenhoekiella aestuarii]
MNLRRCITRIPSGYSEGMFNDRKYGITRTDFNNGKSLKIYAEELGGTDFISLNFYRTESKDVLKPCEMPREKVIDFLKNFKPING